MAETKSIGQTTVNMYMFIQHIQQVIDYVLNQWRFILTHDLA